VLLALLALLPLLGALVGWLFIRQWMIWACVLTAVLLCGSLAWFFYERNQ
jgi:threonine/homoserine efflux transporter RhtA